MKPIGIVIEGLKWTSHSARSAWIETTGYDCVIQIKKVALRKECVD